MNYMSELAVLSNVLPRFQSRFRVGNGLTISNLFVRRTKFTCPLYIGAGHKSMNESRKVVEKLS